MNDEFQQSSCAGKEPFTSPQDAAKAQRNQRKRHKATLDTYRCKFCGAFHIGAPTLTIRKQMRAVQ